MSEGDAVFSKSLLG